MIWGYARVSSAGQARDGNGLDVQRSMLEANGASEVLSDVFTGTTMDRPQWDRLMGLVSEGDTIVVTKLDRIARTSSGGFEAVKSLLARGVSVHVLNMGRVDDTPTGRLVLNIMLAFAEFERDMIVERLAEGRQQAKASNPLYMEGRPRSETPTDVLLRLRAEHDAGAKTWSQCAEELGVSERTVRRRMREIERSSV